MLMYVCDDLITTPVPTNDVMMIAVADNSFYCVVCVMAGALLVVSASIIHRSPILW